MSADQLKNTSAVRPAQKAEHTPIGGGIDRNLCKNFRAVRFCCPWPMERELGLHPCIQNRVKGEESLIDGRLIHGWPGA